MIRVSVMHPSFVLVAHLPFESVEAYGAAFAPNVDAIMGDVPDYTGVEPIVQISEIRF